MAEAKKSISPRTISLVAIVVIVIVGLGLFVGTTLNGPVNTILFDSTVTTAYTIPCASSLLNKTSITSTINGSQLPNFAALFGNFSEMTVVLSGYDENGNSITTSSFVVLNRSSSSGSGEVYEVNVTTVGIEPNVVVQGSQNSTTTIVRPGNTTNVESGVFVVSSNGSVIQSVGGSIGGNQQAADFRLQGSMLFFTPLLNVDLTPSNQLAVVNTTTVHIGSVSMKVTNYEHASLVDVETMEGCNGMPSSSYTSTISNWTFQAGKVPGTNGFTLMTEYSQQYSILSNSTSIAASNLSLYWKVTSVEVA